MAFANDKILPMDHSYINTNGNRYINCSDGNQYPLSQNNGPMSMMNPNAHMTNQGYVRHSGFQPMDSCGTEATIISSMEQGEKIKVFKIGFYNS